MLVDKNASYPNRPVVLEAATFYGRLENIFVIGLQPGRTLGLEDPTNLILAAIRTCSDVQTKGRNRDLYYYSQEGHLEVIDMNCVQCLIGRVKDENEWAIVDRSQAEARPVFVDDLDE